MTDVSYYGQIDGLVGEALGGRRPADSAAILRLVAEFLTALVANGLPGGNENLRRCSLLHRPIH